MAENELFQAVRSNDLDRARQLLLENQVDVDSKNSFGSTALITACRRGNVAFILLLLEKGANINLQDSAGYTALLWACQYTDLEVARLLLASGADIDVENYRGKTAYTVASKPVKDEIKQWYSTEGKKKAKPSNEETVQRTQRVPRDKGSITLKSTQLPEVTPQNELEQPSSATFFDDVATDGRSVGRYREWKQDYEKAYKNLLKLLQRNPDLTPVRIAVLDTGLDLNHPTVQASPPTGRRNFLTGDENVYDQDGHGTFVTGLLMDYAPHAEIFVGKISEGNVVAGTDIIADAIRYAVDEWKVDIISMSFGYPDSWAEEIAALRDALRYAQTKGVLLFAAASNAGSSRVRAFPARSTDVICVLSTCAQGKPSQFSPPAIKGDANLATVGEDVESLMRSDSSGQGLLTCVKSGTSFATPIMAGIAAMLVRYVRILLPENKNDVMNKAVMDKLLIGVAQKGNEHNKSAEYHFVNVYPSKNCILGGLENKYMRYELKKIIL
ncbi:hypothetical protein MCOR11_004819 [Pyricularia oryzae]|nr:hypothetical protein MCOR11_004819 [Pyricularia oryzae]KAI6543616.1 hypothetical protein MCOR05_003130 [Pyricularia oryzae]